ncbi:hypothetical protein EB810_06065 [Altererythrobacter sp. FM1]|nr:hypothetical protein EB810_06065 [Altererythrobacter sp. FM1]
MYGAYIDAGLEQDRIDNALCAGDASLVCGIQRSNAFLNSPDGTRFKGAMEAASGTAAVFFSFTGGLASCVETVGAGCAAGAAGVLAGADQAVTGTRKLFTGKEVLSFRVTGLMQAGMSRDDAELTYFAATAGIAIAEGGVGLLPKAGQGR